MLPCQFVYIYVQYMPDTFLVLLYKFQMPAENYHQINSPRMEFPLKYQRSKIHEKRIKVF